MQAQPNLQTTQLSLMLNHTSFFFLIGVWVTNGPSHDIQPKSRHIHFYVEEDNDSAHPFSHHHYHTTPAAPREHNDEQWPGH